MINPDVDNIIFDSILTQALTDYSKDYLSKIPSERELSTKLAFSDEFLNKMDKLIGKHKKDKLIKKTLLYFKKYVAAILIIAGLVFGTLMLSQPVRATIQNVIIEWLEKYTKFEFQSEKDEIEIIHYMLGYIPEDFIEKERFTFDGIIIVEYNNSSNEKIIFEYSPTTEDYSINLDNENSDYRVVSIDNYKVYLFESKVEGDRNYLLWEDNGYTFKLISEINTDEIIKIAKNIKNS